MYADGAIRALEADEVAQDVRIPEMFVQVVGIEDKRSALAYGTARAPGVAQQDQTVRIAHGYRDAARRVVHRIQNGQVIRADFGRAVQRAVRVQSWIPLVGRDLIVQIHMWISPVPHRDNNVTLETLWSGWFRRNCAAGDAIGPVRVHLQSTGAECVHSAGHVA